MYRYKNALSEILGNAHTIGIKEAYDKYCMEHLGWVDNGTEKCDLLTICEYAVSWFPKTFDTPQFWPQYEELFPMVCPKTGEFTAYKKVSLLEFDSGDFGITTLTIPETAKRSSAFGNKCRASEVIVDDILAYDSLARKPIAHVRYGQSLRNAAMMPISEQKADYIVGYNYLPDEFDENRWHECSHGVHFFMTPQEAISYAFF